MSNGRPGLLKKFDIDGDRMAGLQESWRGSQLAVGVSMSSNE